MNAPQPALVAPRPERLQLVGQRRQMLAVMHQRLMFGMLVYAGLIALIALRILYLAAFGDHAGRKEGRPRSFPIAATFSTATASRSRERSTPGPSPSTRPRSSATSSRSRRSSRNSCRSTAPSQYFAHAALRQAILLPSSPRFARAGRSGECDRRAGACDRPRARPALPADDLAAHVLGFTGIDGHGGAGVERAFNPLLSEPGAPAASRWSLSVSSRVQQALEAELGEASSISPPSAPQASSWTSTPAKFWR